MGRGEYFEAKLIELDREFIDLKLENSIIKRDLRETQAKLKACETERELESLRVEKFADLVIKYDKKLQALEKIAREGFDKINQFDDTLEQARETTKEALNKIDELMNNKGDKNV